MARKRKRSPRWAGLLALVAGLHLVVGFAFSPLTGLRSVRMEVAGTGVDAEAVAKRLDTLRGRPWLSVGSNLPRSLIAQDPWVLQVKWSSNPFGMAVAKVAVRKPVAVLASVQGKVLLTEDGMWLPGNPPAGLPAVTVPPASLASSAGIGSVSDGPRLADWVVRVTKVFDDAEEVELNDTGVLSLRRKSGLWIVFGSWVRTDDKLRRATEVLGNAKPGSDDVLNITVPENAVWSKRESKQ
ncbi:MAG: cell division protein FtsQ/DivIB [Fimbriimonadaceae bacterium]